MSKLINPVLFSQHFSLNAKVLAAAELLDPVLNSDTKLFIDPLLLASSNNRDVSGPALTTLKSRFSEIIQLISASEKVDDVAWRNAAKRLALEERPETCLGYGGASTSGSSRPLEIKKQVLTTAKEIVALGEKDPQIISLMGLFEEGVGPDTISDLTTNIIFPHLCAITTSFCKANGVPIKKFSEFNGVELPENPYRAQSPVVLVPKDILRELPLAADWSDVSRVVSEIEEIRDRFNDFLGPIAEATVSERKRALKKAVLSSLDDFRHFFQEMLTSSDNYDPNEDALNFFAFRALLSSDLSAFAGRIQKEQQKDSVELLRIVREIIEHFRQLVTNNNLWELLWTPDRKPKRERAAQLLFFAVADCFCKANNIDISPETNSGGGPVDFKFSSGYANRVLVEVKRSSGTVVHGYKKQTEVYKNAAQTDAAIFLIINVGGMGRKLADIRAHHKAVVESGERPIEIEVVDARPKESATNQ